eukprot:TRINITY_DN18623_c0_g1_i1.p1 TRINITY_DN18623_c0_g1~~TRINITY_DN18623_c0_g1_i1.p1  ORF type:complete len:273 (+),score=108.91 TRINITY_DN18623_c0_g1_i1:129-947(+)
MFGGFISSITEKIYNVIEEEKKALEEEHAKTTGACPPGEDTGNAKGGADDESDDDEEEVVATAVAEVKVPALPWEGLSEAAMKQVKLLTKSRHNFTKDPPQGVEFEFDFDKMLPCAMAALEEDAELSKVRFWLVPRYIREPRFWRNYFYRISLIKDALGLDALNDEERAKAEEQRAAKSTPDCTEGGGGGDEGSDGDSDVLVVPALEPVEALEVDEDEEMEKRLAEAAAPIVVDSNELDFLDDDVLGDAEFDDEEWRRELEKLDISSAPSSS